MRSWAGVHLLASDSRGLVTLMRLLRDPSTSFSEEDGLQDVRLQGVTLAMYTMQGIVPSYVLIKQTASALFRTGLFAWCIILLCGHHQSLVILADAETDLFTDSCVLFLLYPWCQLSRIDFTVTP